MNTHHEAFAGTHVFCIVRNTGELPFACIPCTGEDNERDIASLWIASCLAASHGIKAERACSTRVPWTVTINRGIKARTDWAEQLDGQGGTAHAGAAHAQRIARAILRARASIERASGNARKITMAGFAGCPRGEEMCFLAAGRAGALAWESALEHQHPTQTLNTVRSSCHRPKPDGQSWAAVLWICVHPHSENAGGEHEATKAIRDAAWTLHGTLPDLRPLVMNEEPGIIRLHEHSADAGPAHVLVIYPITSDNPETAMWFDHEHPLASTSARPGAPDAPH